jgi:hypothetical protein
MTALISTLYISEYRTVKAMENEAARNANKAVGPSDQPISREYVLEIIGMGASLDKYRQGGLWTALAGGNPYVSIRDMNPQHWPWQGQEKIWDAAGNAGNSAENAILDTPRYWGAPTFNAEFRYLDPRSVDRPNWPQGGIAMMDVLMRMPVLAGRELSERPDHIVEKIFEFFDQNPTVPYVILGSSDSTSLRSEHGTTERYLQDGWYVPEKPNASAVFVLARRERVDLLRPFVFTDLEEPQPDVDVLNRYGIARRVWLNHLKLQRRVPVPVDPDLRDSVQYDRNPTSEEWLADLELFSKRADIQEISSTSFHLAHALSKKPRISTHWKPKPWFPVPWNTEQLEQFDALPTLGFLHRPVFVKMTDKDGKLLKHTEQRQAALQQGWKAALETLPEAQRAVGPARVIVATGGKTSQLIDFHGLLRHVGENGVSKFDPDKPTSFIDVDRRLGDTGATTFFMQTAIGVMGSYREGGVSAAFNLRDPTEASIIFISPPSDEKRKSQHHAIGGDVLRNATVPMIDPKNYEDPIVK